MLQLEFTKLNGIVIQGGGIINGRGQQWWLPGIGRRGLCRRGRIPMAGDGAGVVVGAIWMAVDEPTSRRAQARQKAGRRRFRRSAGRRGGVGAAPARGCAGAASGCRAATACRAGEVDDDDARRRTRARDGRGSTRGRGQGRRRTRASEPGTGGGGRGSRDVDLNSVKCGREGDLWGSARLVPASLTSRH